MFQCTCVFAKSSYRFFSVWGMPTYSSTSKYIHNDYKYFLKFPTMIASSVEFKEIRRFFILNMMKNYIIYDIKKNHNFIKQIENTYWSDSDGKISAMLLYITAT